MGGGGGGGGYVSFFLFAVFFFFYYFTGLFVPFCVEKQKISQPPTVTWKGFHSIALNRNSAILLMRMSRLSFPFLSFLFFFFFLFCVVAMVAVGSLGHEASALRVRGPQRPLRAASPEHISRGNKGGHHLLAL